MIKMRGKEIREEFEKRLKTKGITLKVEEKDGKKNMIAIIDKNNAEVLEKLKENPNYIKEQINKVVMSFKNKEKI